MLSAAKYLGVAPWDLQQQPLTWLYQAEEAAAAEAHYQKVQSGKGKHGDHGVSSAR